MRNTIMVMVMTSCMIDITEKRFFIDGTVSKQ